MKYIAIFILFLAFNLRGQTLVDSTEVDTSKLIYTFTGDAIGKDSFYRKTYHYTENGKDFYIHKDTLIMRISYLNTEAFIWYEGSGQGFDEAPVEGVNSCTSDCSIFKVVFDQSRVMGNISIGEEIDRISITVSGWYDISYTAVMTISTEGDYKIGISSDNGSFTDYARELNHMFMAEGKTYTFSRTSCIYLDAGDNIFLLASGGGNIQLANYSLKVKLKL